MRLNVFVVNCGSSSLKYSVVDVAAGRSLVSGVVERIGTPAGRLRHGSTVVAGAFPDHAAALAAVLAVEPAIQRLGAVAHRVVHGGERFSGPVVVNDAVVATIRDLAALAPLHNPVNADGIEVARRAFPDIPHVAVFDTAFHATIPPHAYTYAVPRDWHVRRYGFHGTSHAYVSRAAADVLEREIAELDLIVLHLGNGASATAVQGGRSIDTSMGMTPLEGLVMGTRSGDVDPAVVLHLLRARRLSADEVDAALNSRSGLFALAGDNDMREVHRRVEAGDAPATLALDVYCYRIRKYVGSYLAVLGGADAIVFTAGVGENDAVVRARSLQGLERLGIAVDPERNAADATIISPDGSPIAVLVVGTDEELEMATQAAVLVAR
jgi:acetate kinase